MYDYRDSLTVAPITRRARRIPTEVALGPDDGLRQRSVVNLDNIGTVRKAQLLNQIGIASRNRMREVDDAIHFALGLSY
jgi:mRNA-degrading endonuclease toxin of MazEF toxin-antitoxin module